MINMFKLIFIGIIIVFGILIMFASSVMPVPVEQKMWFGIIGMLLVLIGMIFALLSK